MFCHVDNPAKYTVGNGNPLNDETLESLSLTKEVQEVLRVYFDETGIVGKIFS